MTPSTQQLPLDFSASASQRMSRARRLAVEQPSMFAYEANIDVHLRSPRVAVADVAGPDPERARPWLERVVGPVQQQSSRRLHFPSSSLDRLLYVAAPAQVTLDASCVAVARALWAHRLGLRPLRVERHRSRLLASSQRWPTALRVVDAPWPAIAALAALDIPFSVDSRAAGLLAERLGASGTHIARAGLAGSAVVLEARRPDLLEALGLPALAHHGASGSGQYRMPLLTASCLLDEPSVECSPDLVAAIRRANRKARPLATRPEFPWELYPFQARDAASAVRILETTGGVLLAGTMGSGKALDVSTEVATPSGPVRIDALRVGDLVLGTDGAPHEVTGVYPQPPRPLRGVVFSDGPEVRSDDDHRWSVLDTFDLSAPARVVDTAELAVLVAGAPNRWAVPVPEPLEFTSAPDPRSCVSASASQLARFLRGDRLALSAAQSAALGVTFDDPRVPESWRYTSGSARHQLLAELLGSDPCSLAGAAVTFTHSSRALCGDVAALVRLHGGLARVNTVAPVSVTCEFAAPCRPISSVSAPATAAEAVCISVASPDECFTLSSGVVTHNTTVGLALVDHLDLWPMLVVAPLAAFSTWQRQLAEMGRSMYLATESPAVSWEKISSGDFDAVVISYDRLHAFVELLESQNFACIVADELQRIRTPSSRRSRALRALAHSVPVRIGLSGTPISNRIEELLPLGSFLVPGEWRPRASARDLAKMFPGDHVEALTDHLGAMMVRRRMEDTGAKLPNRRDHRVMVQLTAEQRRALADLAAEAERARTEEGFTHLHAFVRLHRMRAIVACPATAGVGGPNPKLTAALELAEDFLAQGRKGVLFCADRQMFRDLSSALSTAGIGHVGIWGSTPIAERIAAEQRFHSDPDVKIVLATIQAASESVTFSPTATFLICTSYVYSPSTLDQMEARIYRLNQTNEVDICYLHAQAPGGTLDDRIVEILSGKRQLIANVVDRQDHVDTTKVHYSLSDLVYLLTGTLDESLVAREADAQAVVDREMAAKAHARATAHRHKTGEFLDDGSVALSAEAYAALASEGLDAALDDPDVPIEDLLDVDPEDRFDDTDPTESGFADES